jgi:hypothetical protein
MTAVGKALHGLIALKTKTVVKRKPRIIADNGFRRRTVFSHRHSPEGCCSLAHSWTKQEEAPSRQLSDQAGSGTRRLHYNGFSSMPNRAQSKDSHR